MKKKSKYGGIGTVSHCTMNPEHLIPRLVDYAKGLHLTRKERSTVCAIGKASQTKKYWHDDNMESVSYDVEALFNILDNHAMPGFYFGSHPGDGADYGFWLSDCFVEDFDGLKVSDLSEVEKGYTGEVLLVNDHGNVSLYAFSRGKSRSIWSLV